VCDTELKRAVEPIRRAAWKQGLPPYEVDDVIQNALFKAWLKRNEYDGSRPFAPWLFGFGMRGIQARRSARSMLGKGKVGLADIATGELPPDRQAETQEDRLLIRALVANAPLSYRRVLQARYWSGMGSLEVATALGISSRAVEGRMARALQWLEDRWSRSTQDKSK
jgi:RNA polymerase sigma-70 factor (ECF subfamily)